MVVAPVDQFQEAFALLRHMAHSWSSNGTDATEAAAWSLWRSQIDADHATADRQLAKQRQAGAEVCAGTPRKPYWHRCDLDELPGAP
jgi:hypothetical protein